MKQAIPLSQLHLSGALCFVIESAFILSLSALTGSYPILLQLMESTASCPCPLKPRVAPALVAAGLGCA